MDLSELTVDQLRNLLREKKLPVYGSKAVLINRLRDELGKLNLSVKEFLEEASTHFYKDTSRVKVAISTVQDSAVQDSAGVELEPHDSVSSVSRAKSDTSSVIARRAAAAVKRATLQVKLDKQKEATGR